jgi:long-subunit fatty acid transport protein
VGVLAFWLSVAAFAQELEISVSPSPVGSGARAAGMADAFVAIADDATAASWNPAGLVQLERPEISVVGSYNGVYEKFFARYHDEVDSEHNAHNVDLNYLSAACPLPFLVLGRNVTVALNYQRKYDFTRRFRLQYNTAAATRQGTPINNLLRMDFEQEGGLSTLTPALAFEVTHRLSLGAALNLWRSNLLSDNSWEQNIRTESFTLFGPTVYVTSTPSREEYLDFTGENVTIGVLWNATQKLNLAARYDSAFTGDADYRLTTAQLTNVLPSPLLPRGSFSATGGVSKETRHVRFPATIALGAAYRANDRLTLSLDVTRTDWNDFWVKDSNGIRHSLVDFSNLEDPINRPHFDPTHTVRFGAEYVFVPKQPDEELKHLWTLRGGLFYDEEPATGKGSPSKFRLLADRGSGEPEPFYGFALGCGFLAYHRVNIDAAYQLRYGPQANRDFIRGITDFREDMVQHRFLLSTVIYF